jgi:hypothetical protein
VVASAGRVTVRPTGERAGHASDTGGVGVGCGNKRATGSPRPRKQMRQLDQLRRADASCLRLQSLRQIGRDRTGSSRSASLGISRSVS